MRDTIIYYESTSNLFIVHFTETDKPRVTGRYIADDPHEMAIMGKAVEEWTKGKW